MRTLFERSLALTATLLILAGITSTATIAPPLKASADAEFFQVNLGWAF